MMTRGDISMSMMRIPLMGWIIALIVVCAFLTLNCGAPADKAPADDREDPATYKSALPPSEVAPETTGEVSSQGGTIPDDEADATGEPVMGDTEEDGSPATDEPVEVEKETGTVSEEDGGYTEAQLSQLSRFQYEKFLPTEEMIEEAIEGFYRIEGAEYLADKSSANKSEKAEIYDVWFSMPEGSDYKKIVATYAAELEEGYTTQGMETENGYATCFVTQKEGEKWNKVIVIFQSHEKPYIEIHVWFDRLFK
jgi:hypothetical protein